MDDIVMRPSLARLALWGLAAAMLAALPVGAQVLADPTMPPPEARQAQGMAPAPVSKGPQLQSVLVGSNGRQVAVIDGQTVRRGEKVNGALLVKVDKNHAVLRRGGQTQVLKLYPDSAQERTQTGTQTRTQDKTDQAQMPRPTKARQADMQHPTKQPANDDRD
ncbi:MAG: hypothetical protein V4578_02245 [Pseudomonadota bacterium]